MAIREYFRFTSSRTRVVTSDGASDSSGRDSNLSGKSDRSAGALKLVKSLTFRSMRTDSSSNSSGSSEGGICNTNDRPEKGVPSWLKKKNKKDANKKPIHPSEKPLTLENIQHQEMLSAFTWDFGTRRASIDRRSIVSGISPGASRMPSFDAGCRPLPADLDDEVDPAQPLFLSPDSAAFARRVAVHQMD